MSDDDELAVPVIGVDVTYLSLLTVVVTVTGELDMATVPQLRATLTAVIDSQPPRTLTIDLAGVSLLDAAAMTALVQIYQYAREQHIAFGLVNPRPLVRRMIEVGGLTTFLVPAPGR